MLAGCSSAWLERCVRDAEVAGSNPVIPTNSPFSTIQGQTREAGSLPTPVRACSSSRSRGLHRSPGLIGPEAQPHNELCPKPRSSSPPNGPKNFAAHGRISPSRAKRPPLSRHGNGKAPGSSTSARARDLMFGPCGKVRASSASCLSFRSARPGGRCARWAAVLRTTFSRWRFQDRSRLSQRSSRTGSEANPKGGS